MEAHPLTPKKDALEWTATKKTWRFLYKEAEYKNSTFYRRISLRPWKWIETPLHIFELWLYRYHRNSEIIGLLRRLLKD